jgi:uncharacterized protein (TIGR02594 family)
MNVTAFDIAQRFVGVRELPGNEDNPFIMAMLRLDQGWPSHDEVPWCSAFVNYVAWLLRLPRSKSLGARSWLEVGVPVSPYTEACVGFDVAILKRGVGEQPGPEVIQAPGHVGFYAGMDHGSVVLLGGNQGNSVGLAAFPVGSVLGIRRLA